MQPSHIRAIVYLLVFAMFLAGYKYGRRYWVPVLQKFSGRKTVEDAIRDYGASARSRLVPFFSKAKVPYPPDKIVFLALKDERRMEVWAWHTDSFVFVRDYAIVKMSGGPGPKLEEGDRQVPEGVYKIIGLNPNSSYHLSMKLNYPNDFDLRHAQTDGRDNPGSNIFIHGKDVSIGCLAMGDRPIEDLFVLVHDVGQNNTTVLISPTDPRLSALDERLSKGPEWLPELYTDLSNAFNPFKDKRSGRP